MPPPSSNSPSSELPIPEPGRAAAQTWVARHLGDVVVGSSGSSRFSGGQSAADAMLASFDVAGYAKRRNEAYPIARRGASSLSPYIRHGLLTLPEVWSAVGDGPSKDVSKFRDELLWQEYARHLYARLGTGLAKPLRRRPDYWPVDQNGQLPWDDEMACVELTVGELEDDGWLVNQTRMWLASHWTVRLGLDWRAGEDYFFSHLLDGSRAANRLGWQWTSGVGSNRAYGFSRWQVERRAPGLCADCELNSRCPIDGWPDDPDWIEVDRNPLLGRDPDPDRTGGPREPQLTGIDPEAVWLTAESLGHNDPALVAHPELPAMFVFDRALLSRLGLSSKRLVFFVETLAELALERPIKLWLDDPVTVLAGRPIATTFAPVPGWRSRASTIKPVAVYPWPWLRRPASASVASFSAWVRSTSSKK